MRAGCPLLALAASRGPPRPAIMSAAVRPRGPTGAGCRRGEGVPRCALSTKASATGPAPQEEVLR
eukprot:1584918-Pyramimonas_sp.AAC.1